MGRIRKEDTVSTMLSKKQLVIVDIASSAAALGNAAGLATGMAIVKFSPTIALGGWLLAAFCLAGAIGALMVHKVCQLALGNPV